MKKAYILLALFIAVIVSASAKPYIFMANKGTPFITVYDTAVDDTAGTIKTGAEISAVKMSYDQKWIYFTSASTNALYRASTKNFSIDGNFVKTGIGPVGVELTDDDKMAYVINSKSMNVAAIELPAMEMRGDPVQLPAAPVAIAISDDYKRSYVAMEGREGVAIIDMRKNKLIYTIPTGVDPWALCLDGKKLFVSNEGIGSVSVVDIMTSKVETEIVTSESPRGICVYKNMLYVAVKNAVDVFDLRDYGKPASIGLEHDAFDTISAKSPSGNRVYVAGYSAAGGKVSVIDPEVNEVISAVEVAGRPVKLAVRQDARTATPTYTKTNTPIPSSTPQPTFTPTPKPTKKPTSRPTPRPKATRKPTPAPPSLLSSDIYGQVLVSRQPVAGVKVKAISKHTDKIITVKTDGNGRFVFKAMPIGAYVFSVEATYIKEKAVAVTVNRGKNPPVVINASRRD